MKLAKLVALLFLVMMLFTGCISPPKNGKPDCLIIKYHGTGLSYWEANWDKMGTLDYDARIEKYEDRQTYLMEDTVVVHKYDGNLAEVKNEYGIYDVNKVYGRKS